MHRSLGRLRKTSSSGALEEEVRLRAATRTKEEIEEDVRLFADKYEDEETKKRVTELLMLDHVNKWTLYFNGELQQIYLLQTYILSKCVTGVCWKYMSTGKIIQKNRLNKKYVLLEMLTCT